ncbi:MAG: alcohol dehydrogenase catalytic domain-containing protein [Thermodesulfobacteriota bacterium]
MRVARYYDNRDIRIEEMPVPKVGPGELLVRIEASGICGSDVMEWYRIKKAPLVLGHEISGDVVEAGDGVDQFKEGARVVVTHHVPCNTCRYCLKGQFSVCDTLRTTNFIPGGFSEFVKVPAINTDRGTFLLPDELSYDDGTFVEPLACVLRGLRTAGFQPGQNILVIGSGISGLLNIQTACALGAGKVAAVDINDYRISAAKRFGAGLAMNADEDITGCLREYNGGFLADLVIICAGSSSAIEQGLRSVERGGTVLFFAPTEPDISIPLPMWDIWRDGIKMTTSYAGAPCDLIQAIELIKAGRVNVGDMVTHRLGLQETAKGFHLVATAADSIKVIIYPQQ